MIRLQPSTSTNSRILNGSAIIVGGSIIMPIAISPEETTRSITRNGTKMTSPMMNALRSSESMNAGTTVKNGVVMEVDGAPTLMFTAPEGLGVGFTGAIGSACAMPGTATTSHTTARTANATSTRRGQWSCRNRTARGARPGTATAVTAASSA